MHFVDRNLFTTAPIAYLSALHMEEQPKWIAYKEWLNDKSLPVVSKPAGKWTHNNIRDPLTLLFCNNCIYCGVYSDKEHDGEVDHFFPKEKDTLAAHIYSWNNYVWACHSCNSKKSNHYPLIDPCNEIEVNEVYFHVADGRYLVKKTASKSIIDKFELTEKQTFINGKRGPDRRKFINKHLIISLSSINRLHEIYEIEELTDKLSKETKEAYSNLQDSIAELREYLASMDYVLLKKEIFLKFRAKYPDFQYSYEDFI